MSWKTDLAVGGGAVASADFLGPRVPPALNVAGLPVAKYAAAAAGAYVGGLATGNKLSLMGALVRGAVALAAADLVTCFVPQVSVPVAGFDLVRIGAGAGGAYLGRKFGG